MADQLSNGPRRGPGGSGRRMLVGLATAALAALVLVALRQGRPRPPEPPVAAPTPAPRTIAPPVTAPPADVPTVDIPVGPVPALAVVEVCPVGTDHRSTLAVSFTLRNVMGDPVTLEWVRPHLPGRGLRHRSTSVREGTCARPGAPRAGRPVRSGEALLVTFRFGLPATCPKPYPVQADLRERGRGGTRTTREGLLNDLGAVDFDTCPGP